MPPDPGNDPIDDRASAAVGGPRSTRAPRGDVRPLIVAPRRAAGRAIVREPRAFLLDEPLSNLDAKLRVQTREEIADLQGEAGVAAA